MFSRVPAVPEVTPDEAAKLQADGALMLDVREADEVAAGRAPETVHVPLTQLMASLGALDRSRKIVAVCRSGNRSATATAVLRKAGYDAANLAGGMKAWQATGKPVIDAEGQHGRVA